MQLSSFTDYALRTLIFVALKRDELASIAEVAASYDISRHHVVKIVQRLQSLGYLETHRGRNGGIELAVDPGAIRVGKLVSELENLALVECLTASGQCVIDGSCRLKKALVEARAAFLGVLDRYTLADLATPRKLPALLALR